MISVLSSSSADSLSKKRLIESAIARLQGSIPDSLQSFAIPTSDSVALAAATHNEALGINAMSVALTSTFYDKGCAYAFARANELPVPDWVVPPSREELIKSALTGRIIVKPTSSSGAFCQDPWGYKVFDSINAFLTWLESNELEERFWIQQHFPNPHYGPYLVMRYHDNPDIWGIHVLKTFDGQIRIFGRCFMHCIEPTYWIQFCLLNPAHTGWALLEKKLRDMASDSQFGSGLLYVQAIDVGGVLMPIDFNLRHGTLFAQYCEAREPDWFERYVECLFGLGDPNLDVSVKHFCIGKVPSEKFLRGLVPQLSRYPGVTLGPRSQAFDPERAYDVAYKDFLFISEADDEEECMRAWQEFRIDTEVLNATV
jgi:hypothetical protein